jgi:hypothetical protein
MALAKEVAASNGIKLQEGCYVGTTGQPSKRQKSITILGLLVAMP